MEFSCEQILSVAAGVFLIPCAVSDFRRKEIPILFLTVVTAVAVAAVLWRIVNGDYTVNECLLSLLPGVFLLLVFVVTGGKIGIGDGVVFIIIGLMIGCMSAFVVMFLSLIFSATWGGYLMLRKKVGKDTSIPWMPFVLAGYLIWYAIAVVPEF